MFKLLETEKVARNTRSCQKVVEQLVESPNGEDTVLLLDTGGKSSLISVNLLSFLVSESDA